MNKVPHFDNRRLEKYAVVLENAKRVVKRKSSFGNMLYLLSYALWEDSDNLFFKKEKVARRDKRVLFEKSVESHSARQITMLACHKQTLR